MESCNFLAKLLFIGVVLKQKLYFYRKLKSHAHTGIAEP